jgi:thioesterase domain-containing protein/acyl carrier protein
VSNPVTVSITAGVDETAAQLTRIWQELLGIESIAVDQNYFDLGGDSPLAVHLFAQIEKIFNVKLPLAILFEAPTIEELARIIRRKASTSGWSPLVAIQPEGTRPNLFCVHGAGGNVLIYRELSQQLGFDQPFYGLQCQGLGGQQPLLTKIEEMAALYVQEIQSVQPHGPYFLGGYCMGGTVAYEIAHQLTARGEQVALLSLFDTVDWSKLNLEGRWLQYSYQIQRVWFHMRNFLLLNLKDQLRFFAEKWKVLRNRMVVWRGFLRSKLVKNQQVHSSESLHLAQIWKNNDHAASRYIPSPLNSFILDIRPLKQYSMFEGPDVHWDKLAMKGKEVITLPVYPAGMLVEPFVKHLAASLKSAIDYAIRGNTAS